MAAPISTLLHIPLVGHCKLVASSSPQVFKAHKEGFVAVQSSSNLPCTRNCQVRNRKMLWRVDVSFHLPQDRATCCLQYMSWTPDNQEGAGGSYLIEKMLMWNCPSASVQALCPFLCFLMISLFLHHWRAHIAQRVEQISNCHMCCAAYLISFVFSMAGCLSLA